jgi:hypothetical protein
MTAFQGSFRDYVTAVAALNASHFSVRRERLRQTVLASRRVGRDEAAEQRWYAEGGNSQSAAGRQPV